MSPEERAALVERGKSMASYTLAHQLADLLAEDGKRLALADTAPHSPGCYSHIDSSLSYCTCWKADYEAAKETGL